MENGRIKGKKLNIISASSPKVIVSGILLLVTSYGVRSQDQDIFHLKPVHGVLGRPLHLSYTNTNRSIQFCTWYPVPPAGRTRVSTKRLVGTISTDTFQRECGVTIKNFTRELVSTWEFIVIFKEALTQDKSDLTLHGRVWVTDSELVESFDLDEHIQVGNTRNSSGTRLDRKPKLAIKSATGFDSRNSLQIVEGFNNLSNLTCCVEGRPLTNVRLLVGHKLISEKYIEIGEPVCLDWEIVQFNWTDHNQQLRCTSEAAPGLDKIENSRLLQVFYEPKIIYSNQTRNNEVNYGEISTERIVVKYSGNPRPTVNWIISKANNPNFIYTEGIDYVLRRPIKTSANTWDSVVLIDKLLEQLNSGDSENILCRLGLRNQMGAAEFRAKLQNHLRNRSGWNSKKGSNIFAAYILIETVFLLVLHHHVSIFT